MARPEIRGLQSVRCFAIVVLLALGGHSVASACNVPVFRYALERWRPDSFRVVIVHRGDLGEAESKLARSLQIHEDMGTANFELKLLDVDKLESPEDKELCDSLGNAALPRLLVQFPAKLGLDEPIWSAALSSDAVARLTDSPVRKELVSRLAAGQTAVWLLLECDDAEKNKAAAAIVEQELRKMEQELKLPELTEDPADRLTAGVPLAVSFSLLRVSRGEAEQPLVEMLLRSESDLAERSVPLVFPVFGRGRALLPLVGAGITPDNIKQSASFLVGACSCQVKEQNPGIDLLLSANWEELLSQVVPPQASSAAGQPALSTAPELVPIPSGSQPGTPVVVATTRSFVFFDHEISSRMLAIGGGIIVVLMLGVVTLIVAFSKRDSAAARQDN